MSSHRAQQVVEAIAAALAANTDLDAAVYTNRTLPVSVEDNEVPCVSVVYGGDEPLNAEGAVNLAYIDSLLEVFVKCTGAGNSEEAMLAALMVLRRQVTVTLMADRSLGLAFVMDTRYGGASAPESDARIDKYVGKLDTRWHVMYRMNLLDPA